MNVDIETIWHDFNALKLNSSDSNDNKPNPSEKITCKICKELDKSTYNEDGLVVCQTCGYVLHQTHILSTNTISDLQPNEFFSKKKFTKDDLRLKKLQEWYMYSKEDKSNFKLKMYVEDKCNKLRLCDEIVGATVAFVTQVIDYCKNSVHGPKRSKVKDGIIIVCLKQICPEMSILEMQKIMEVDTKYITKANKLLLELQNSQIKNEEKQVTLLVTNKLQPHTETFQITTPEKYILSFVDILKNSEYQSIILRDTRKLIDLVSQYDLLLDNTPLSIAVGCLYYIIQYYQLTIDIDNLSSYFNISNVTIVKTCNKLQKYKVKLNKMLFENELK
jgi:transcription initiation factor TFIIIB Brf1 subunit/transcription initiation factor TFIIB